MKSYEITARWGPEKIDAICTQCDELSEPPVTSLQCRDHAEQTGHVVMMIRSQTCSLIPADRR